MQTDIGEIDLLADAQGRNTRSPRADPGEARAGRASKAFSKRTSRIRRAGYPACSLLSAGFVRDDNPVAPAVLPPVHLAGLIELTKRRVAGSHGTAYFEHRPASSAQSSAM